ncbi:photosystem II reaction center protein Psb28 [Picosynechococcus sp. NKBG15041c]|uniref:photosystem II reaction center protein Psb28 n=1 Tax=Picosynechococcus sp. NKBG15041c TaxID=1407650 RepID=UPI0004052263|nr:photosystem II reaction center protein Psb28 [Picosynechococcus sp. NKBG15041c]
MFNFFKPKASKAAPPPLPEDTAPRIEFFRGITEELDSISLQKNPRTGIKSIEMTFARFNALERFQSFTSGFNGVVTLIDEEGDIAMTPSSCRIVFGGEEGEDLRGVVCRVEIDNSDHWERVMRFLHRYADEHGFSYGETTPENQPPDAAAPDQN